MNKVSCVSAVCLAAVLSLFAAGPVEVAVDPASPVGAVKPVNGVGQPPMVDVACGAPMFRYLKEAGIPYSRLHDVGGAFGGNMWADIPNIFRNFDADESDAANYDFEATDHLVRELMNNGVEPFFRLGVTIENHGFRPKHVFPPKDFAKWARICEHVIRHYTEGWADGFRYKIAYWEIWNEPDGAQDPAQNCMWKDSFARYCDFYGVVAPYLKGKFPHLKIGGYASCGFYAAVGAAHVSAANSSPRMQYFVTCAKEFLGRARKEKWPLDYFSYHSYSEVPGVLEQVAYADRLLTEYGFTRDKCERIFNEWLPRVSLANLGSAFQASAIAAELVGLQNGPCDLACIYDARCAPSSYAALFNPLTQKPHKAYYAFTAFNELHKLRTAVKAEVKGGAVYACAASDGGRIAILVANPTRESIPCRLSVPGFVLKSRRLTDDTRTDQAMTGIPQELPPYSFVVILGEKS